MIKENEFRTGNWFIDICGTPSQYSFEWQKHYFDLGIDVYGVVKPIPLTPEILEKYGFEKMGEWFVEKEYRETKIAISIALKKTTIGINEEYGIENVQYLHQLQNLYFSLTGKELQLILK